MELNKEQAKHLADTLRVVAIAQFGYFGYDSLKVGMWPMVAVSFLLFVALEFLALTALED